MLPLDRFKPYALIAWTLLAIQLAVSVPVLAQNYDDDFASSRRTEWRPYRGSDRSYPSMNSKTSAARRRIELARSVEPRYLDDDDRGDLPVVIGTLTPTIDDRDDPRMRRTQFRLAQAVASPAPIIGVPPGGAVLGPPQYPGYPGMVRPQPAPYAAPIAQPGCGQPYYGAGLGSLEPEYSWCGFYIGAHGGYGWTTFNPVISQTGAIAPLDFNTFSISHHANGPLFGGHAGYDRQFRNLVLGVEADFDAAGLSGTQTTTFASLLSPGVFTNSVMVTDRIDWLASVRARAGFAAGRNLFYLTGGVAWESFTQDFLVSETRLFSSAAGHYSATRLGYVAGGGYERMIAPHWTVRGEYLYYAFDHTNTAVAPFNFIGFAGNSVTVSTPGNHIHTVRLGVSYKF